VEITQQVAESLGFPKPHYLNIERERRWLCAQLPGQLIVRTEEITDLYVDGARLRLREARPRDGGPAMLRITRKADADPRTRLISSIYLSEEDFAVLSGVLPGVRLSKLRHRLEHPSAKAMCVDEFLGPLGGLLIAEAEFETDEALGRFSPPSFVGREITDDPRYSGHALATQGLPQPG
jgi:CYTH domain-containing protein